MMSKSRMMIHDFFPPTQQRVLEIMTHTTTGPKGSLTAPGVHFDLFLLEDEFRAIQTVDLFGKMMLRVGIGVMDRNAVRRLHVMLGEFLNDFPEEA